MGKGTFATVYRAVDVNTGDMRAIKVGPGESHPLIRSKY